MNRRFRVLFVRPRPPIEVLEIPDEFEHLDPRLPQLLRSPVAPEIDAALAKWGDHDG